MSRAVVLDNGSCTSRAGFADESLPELVFPTCLAEGKGRSMYELPDVQEFIGEGAYQNRHRMELINPIKDGIVTNWDAMEKIWAHTFRKLNVEAADQPVLVTGAHPTWKDMKTDKAQRERMTQVMFETFNTPLMYMAFQPVLGIYTSGQTTGLAIESGSSYSYTLAVYERHGVHSTMNILPIGGRHLTEHLEKMMRDGGSDRFEVGGFELAQDMKEKHCCVRLNEESIEEAFYELPDGNKIEMGKERFLCPEALFHPGLLGRPERGDSIVNRSIHGIHILANQSIQRSDVERHKELYSNIVLCGGNTLFEGMRERLLHELTHLAPATMQANVAERPKHNAVAWLGGSILASLDVFKDMCISRKEYEECGSAVVHQKCM
mmetsp:Transcript_148555/g.262335  ORF Transcript_148555/g.262335 Transcript_148555/m.262335 type:complete len:378 (+) Transcript_148555:40-1173(+)